MKSCIKSACEALIAHESHLNDLDVGCGDGDTGSTLATGCDGRFSGSISVLWLFSTYSIHRNLRGFAVQA